MSETPDIVERLRKLGSDESYAPPAMFANACSDAAKEITRLRAALSARTEECARVAETFFDGKTDNISCHQANGADKIARAIRALPTQGHSQPSSQDVPGYTLDKSTMTYRREGRDETPDGVTG